MRFEYADANRQLTSSLVGTGIAVLTFLLVFLYGRYSPDSLDEILFRITLGVLVVGIFLLGFAGTNYYHLVETLERKGSNSGWFLRRADRFFAAGLALMLLVPGFILITVGIYDVGAVAFALWGVAMYEIRSGQLRVLRGTGSSNGPG